MAMPAWIPETWGKLSADNQRKAEALLRDLLSEQQNQPKPQKTHVRFDELKGKIIVFDNFDDPIPGFEDYT